MKRLALSILLIPAALAQSGLQVGESAGAVELLSLERFPVSMNNYAEHRGTVIALLSARDQRTDAVADSLRSLNQQYRRKKVMLLSVFPDPDQTPAEIRAYCQARGLNFPVYQDPGLKTTRRLGASYTPEFFLLDKDGKLIFRGSASTLGSVLEAFVSGAALPATEPSVEGTPIGAKLPARQIENPFGAIGFSSELIFDSIPGFPAHHCSSIAEAKNGDLIVIWYGGS